MGLQIRCVLCCLAFSFCFCLGSFVFFWVGFGREEEIYIIFHAFSIYIPILANGHRGHVIFYDKLTTISSFTNCTGSYGPTHLSSRSIAVHHSLPPTIGDIAFLRFPFILWLSSELPSTIGNLSHRGNIFFFGFIFRIRLVLYNELGYIFYPLFSRRLCKMLRLFLEHLAELENKCWLSV